MAGDVTVAAFCILLQAHRFPGGYSLESFSFLVGSGGSYRSVHPGRGRTALY